MFRYRHRLYNSTRTWLTFDRNYAAARYTGQREVLLKTSRKKRSATSSEKFPLFLFFFFYCAFRISVFIFIRRDAIKLNGIFIRDYGILIGISRRLPIFLNFLQRRKRERKRFLWESGKEVRINEIRHGRNEVLAMRREVCNWIRLYLHWFPSCAPNATSIFASGLLLLSTATSSGDKPSLLTL